MRTITTCAGIGDTIWLFQKLTNQPESFNWRIPGGEPRRGKQIFDLLPSLVNSFDYVENLGYKKIKAEGFRGNWSHSPAAFTLEANTHLEKGKRIEKFLPDLVTSYTIPWVTSDDDHNTAVNILGDIDTNLIGIYTSAYQKADNWKGWTAKQWYEFCMMFPPDVKFVVIGAAWDTNMSADVLQLLGSRAINTVGQPLCVVIEIMKRLDMFVGFPSGLSILNETLAAKQTIMFYPKHLTAMINTWADPARIESGAYKGCLWCEPVRLYEWIKNCPASSLSF